MRDPRPQSPIFVKTYDFLLWLIPLTLKFPKSQRFLLAERLSRMALDFYDLILDAVLEPERLEAQADKGKGARGGDGVSVPFAVAWGQAENRVLRGGSFNNNWNNVRVANRNNNNPSNRNNNIGFRCAGGAPGVFLEGQVRLVHGRGASAKREKSRPVPGWVPIRAQPKTNWPRPVW